MTAQDFFRLYPDVAFDDLLLFSNHVRKEALEEAVKLVCRFKLKKVCNPYDLTQHDTAETIETEIRALLNQDNKKEE